MLLASQIGKYHQPKQQIQGIKPIRLKLRRQQTQFANNFGPIHSRHHCILTMAAEYHIIPRMGKGIAYFTHTPDNPLASSQDEG
jgi:hypothetical protein